MDEADVARLATELHLLVGHGLTAEKLKEAPLMRSLVSLPPDSPEHVRRSAILSAIRKALGELRSSHLIPALNRELSAKQIQRILTSLLLLTSESRGRFASARRRAALKSLGLPDDESSITWWRRRPQGPEYQLMEILARELLRYRITEPAVEVSRVEILLMLDFVGRPRRRQMTFVITPRDETAFDPIGVVVDSAVDAHSEALLGCRRVTVGRPLADYDAEELEEIDLEELIPRQYIALPPLEVARSHIFSYAVNGEVPPRTVIRVPGDQPATLLYIDDYVHKFAIASLHPTQLLVLSVQSREEMKVWRYEGIDHESKVQGLKPALDYPEHRFMPVSRSRDGRHLAEFHNPLPNTYSGLVWLPERRMWPTE